MQEHVDVKEKAQIMRDIVRMEWQMFQKVNHMDGRAQCQDDKVTFYFMRLSQFGEWTLPLLMSYSEDLKDAASKERNLIMEKYAYMMEFTDSAYYTHKLAPFLPMVDSDTMQILREISDCFVEWDQAFSLRYPNFSAAGRPTNAQEDSAQITSVETYTIGELKTYSRKTLELYREYVRQTKESGINLVFEIRSALAAYYGYASVEDAENKMKQS